MGYSDQTPRTALRRLETATYLAVRMDGVGGVRIIMPHEYTGITQAHTHTQYIAREPLCLYYIIKEHEVPNGYRHRATQSLIHNNALQHCYARGCSVRMRAGNHQNAITRMCRIANARTRTHRSLGGLIDND